MNKPPDERLLTKEDYKEADTHTLGLFLNTPKQILEDQDAKTASIIKAEVEARYMNDYMEIVKAECESECQARTLIEWLVAERKIRKLIVEKDPNNEQKKTFTAGYMRALQVVINKIKVAKAAPTSKGDEG